MRTIISLCVCLALPASAAPAEKDLPVTRVTAFSSGVAYFEHGGEVDGDATVLLKFKAEQINDVLKSLVLMDLGGGDVSGVSYASRDPVARALKSFGIDISGEPSLGELLRQVRGAEVVLAAPDKLRGKVLGVETRTEQLLDPKKVITRQVLNLLTDEGIKAVALDTIGSIRLADEKLNAELNKALALLAESRDSNRKPVSIHFTGRGRRDVRLGYIAEAPIWKTSYRLVLSDEGVRLQGWAIVENTSDFDWSGVELTLISGRPISFIQDLYTPLYLPRPVVEPELYASLRPQMYEEGLEAEEKAKVLAAKTGERAALARRRAPAAPGRVTGRGLAAADEADALEARKAQARALQQGVQSVAAAGKVGELFRYRIGKKVTIERRKSAMLSIVNQAVQARKVSIYNAGVLAGHPLNGLWLTNDTQLSLLAGPVTVFDEATYAGDARIDNLPPKDKRLLSYAIDLKVTVDASNANASQLTSVRILKGVLELLRKHTYSRTYLIKNKAEKKRSVLVEHPIRSGWKLVQPAEPTDKTPTVYRFEVDVAAGETGKLLVKEERTQRETVHLLEKPVSSLQYYTTNAEIPEKVRQAIAEAIRRKQALEAVSRDIRDTEKQIASLEADQRRIRANMTALDKASTSYKTFERKLMDTEKQIEKLQGDLKTLRQKEKDLRAALEEHLAGLRVG